MQMKNGDIVYFDDGYGRIIKGKVSVLLGRIGDTNSMIAGVKWVEIASPAGYESPTGGSSYKSEDQCFGTYDECLIDIERRYNCRKDALKEQIRNLSDLLEFPLIEDMADNPAAVTAYKERVLELTGIEVLE